MHILRKPWRIMTARLARGMLALRRLHALQVVSCRRRAISTAQVKKFQEDGYLVIEGSYGGALVTGLKREMSGLLRDFRPDPTSFSVFSTKEQTR